MTHLSAFAHRALLELCTHIGFFAAAARSRSTGPPLRCEWWQLCVKAGSREHRWHWSKPYGKVRCKVTRAHRRWTHVQASRQRYRCVGCGQDGARNAPACTMCARAIGTCTRMQLRAANTLTHRRMHALATDHEQRLLPAALRCP